MKHSIVGKEGNWSLVTGPDAINCCGTTEFLVIGAFPRKEDAEFAKRCFEWRDACQAVETGAVFGPSPLHFIGNMLTTVQQNTSGFLLGGAAAPAHEVHEDDGEIDTPLYIEPKEGEK